MVYNTKKYLKELKILRERCKDLTIKTRKTKEQLREISKALNIIIKDLK